LHQNDHGLGARLLQILEQLGAALGLSFPGLDLPKDYHTPVRHHRQGIAEGVDRLRIELACGPLIEVEVAHAWLEGLVHDRSDRLVLQHVLAAIEVVDRGELALVQGSEQGVERMHRHA
jgi:hypothetical protein